MFSLLRRVFCVNMLLRCNTPCFTTGRLDSQARPAHRRRPHTAWVPVSPKNTETAIKERPLFRAAAPKKPSADAQKPTVVGGRLTFFCVCIRYIALFRIPFRPQLLYTYYAQRPCLDARVMHVLILCLGASVPARWCSCAYRL